MTEDERTFFDMCAAGYPLADSDISRLCAIIRSQEFQIEHAIIACNEFRKERDLARAERDALRERWEKLKQHYRDLSQGDDITGGLALVALQRMEKMEL